MSDTYYIFVPQNPYFAPSSERIAEAAVLAGALFPKNDEIEPAVSEAIQFFSPYGNFEMPRCPACSALIEDNWWSERMGQDWDGSGFRLEFYAMPCCGKSFTLNELDYSWPGAFGRFGLSIRNPNCDLVSPGELAQLEALLDCPLRIVYGHL